MDIIWLDSSVRSLYGTKFSISNVRRLYKCSKWLYFLIDFKNDPLTNIKFLNCLYLDEFFDESFVYNKCTIHRCVKNSIVSFAWYYPFPFTY